MDFASGEEYFVTSLMVEIMVRGDIGYIAKPVELVSSVMLRSSAQLVLVETHRMMFFTKT